MMFIASFAVIELNAFLSQVAGPEHASSIQAILGLSPIECESSRENLQFLLAMW
jgi:hypothetical protein